ncbi:MAG: tRNA (adenosine(37)-N6)-threonylcarbamoyltransferase complex dimerization subunit type 1 TsaB [Tatlockia sp.]|nr:tRNA (adenosine(37)-N6)-threonylcarbamoyltransferase complex dimerization subunit type 1 TsaB [Tatlockia sp.]
MNLLAIDTSTDRASVALSIKGELLSEEQGSQRTHAQLLLPMIERMLAKAEVGLNQLDAIVYGRGPGSFTGLRIACAVAKGLAYAADLPLYPVSSLAAIANEALDSHKELPNTRVLALIDARMNQLYWSLFSSKGFEVEEQVSAAADIKFELADNTLILAGVGYESYLLQLAPEQRAKISNHYAIYPKAAAMIRLALTGKINTVTASDALPFYIRNQITQGEPRG